jgi:methyl-accepting chemotaxis protein
MSKGYAMMDSSEILQLIEGELEHLRQRVQERVSEAAHSSEAATLATGGMLMRVLHEARAQVDDLGALSSRVSGADGDSAGQIAADTSREMRSFVTELSRQLSDQVSSLHRATEAMQSILRVGARIDEIATASRFLALNAVVEASRLGDAGAASRVIAQEMKELSQSVEAANGQVSELARQLSTTLPEVAATTSHIDEKVSAFRHTFDEKLRALDNAFAELRTVAQTSVDKSSARLESIVQSSHEALSQLQFQDPMVQGLRKIDTIISNSQSNVQMIFLADGERMDPTAIQHIESVGEEMDGGTLALF